VAVSVWGIIPAAGAGTRIQPLAFSKELLPVGARREDGYERPRAVSEYLLERMVLGGADRICFVISPWKSDILQYYGGALDEASIAYVIQDQAAGLCDAIFRALPLIGPEEPVIVGLPDTIWFPEDALAALPDNTQVHCAHEYTLSNIKFARACEPDNTALLRWSEDAQALRAAGKPTLPTTIGHEKTVNPFLRADVPAIHATLASQFGAPVSDRLEAFRIMRGWKDKFR
jgi:dTDP-glucose pyrophosphorylase